VVNSPYGRDIPPNMNPNSSASYPYSSSYNKSKYADYSPAASDKTHDSNSPKRIIKKKSNRSPYSPPPTSSSSHHHHHHHRSQKHASSKVSSHNSHSRSPKRNSRSPRSRSRSKERTKRKSTTTSRSSKSRKSRWCYTKLLLINNETSLTKLSLNPTSQENTPSSLDISKKVNKYLLLESI